MQRGSSILVTAACVLNANAKIRPYAFYPGVNHDAVASYLEQGAGLLQLPCPETSFLGLSRFGQTREQYDVPAYREHCRRILYAPLLEMEAYVRDGCRILGILGINQSPSCGVDLTCEGYTGGEMDPESIARQQERLKTVPGRGVFMQVLEKMLAERGLDIPLIGLDEAGS